ncbi:MAG: metal-dependent transcriptional regulator [Gemmatimonadaceae bacterium]|nr:metal-dependent transcriptional regulator [Gemmatimonadaceae bacterium]
MPDPRTSLLVFGFVLMVTLVIVWPRRGILARIMKQMRHSERVRIEDTLKYLFHRAADGHTVHVDALAGSLQISRDRAQALLEQLVASEQVMRSGTTFALTERGRLDALRVVRTHRIVEQYLADRTGLESHEWHEIADEREHLFTTEEIESLSRRLGDPRFDPHGDPIPSRTGEMPVHAPTLLAALEPGEAGVIVHLEDEPVARFDRLRRLGFALDKRLVVRARTSVSVEVELDGKTVSVPPDYELAIGVVGTDGGDTVRPRTLDDIDVGESARVVRLSRECRGAQRRRLLDLGVVPGTVITAEMRSAGGDPMAYRIRGALIALRRQQAVWIEVDPTPIHADLFAEPRA